jgi:hypothetical protein
LSPPIFPGFRLPVLTPSGAELTTIEPRRTALAAALPPLLTEPTEGI